MAFPAYRRSHRSTNGRAIVLFASDPIASLIAALGGNSIVLGAYAANKGVTLVSGAVSQWDDARGPVGFGPSLAQATTTKRPLLTGGAIVFDGVDDNLMSADVSLFDLSTDKSVFAIGAVTGGTTATIASLSNAAGDRNLGLNTNSTASGFAPAYRDSVATNTMTITGLALGTTPRLIAAGKTTTSCIADIPNKAEVTRTPTGLCASEAAHLAVGDWRQSSPGNPCAWSAQVVLVLAAKYTATQLAAVMNFATAQAGVVAA